MIKELPEEFKNRMRAVLKDEYDEFIISYESEPVKGLRLNPLKTKDIPAGFALEQVPWCETGYYYDADLRPGKHPYHAAGVYYIQEPSAMLPGELGCLAIQDVLSKKGYVRVLDMCAAPGGKATHLAGAIGDNGILIANEPVPSRARILSQNIERLGIRHCVVTVEEPDRLAEVFPGYFDVVLTDVPCSGEGMFRKDDTAIEEWSPENVDNCIIRGRTITDAAHRCLKPGGYLVYSTCTFEPGEDEEAVEEFMNSHPGYSPAELAVTGPELKSSHFYRIWPHRQRGEGHFATALKYGDDASWEKETAPDDDKIRYMPEIRPDMKECLEAFINDVLTEEGRDCIKGCVFAYGDNIYVSGSEIARIASNRDKSAVLRIERAGLHLGEYKKGRIEPSHSLSLALKPEMFRRTVDLRSDDETVLKYLRGESIGCDPGYKGYCIVRTDGYPLGWGKATGGILKNHYPKGLRWLS